MFMYKQIKRSKKFLNRSSLYTTENKSMLILDALKLTVS